MRRFAQLFVQLDQTTKTNAKVDVLAEYFSQTSDTDKLWTIALLSGRRPRRTVTTTLLRQWAAEAAHIPLWLFEETYPVVGDLAETIALVLPPNTQKSQESLSYWIGYIQDLKDFHDVEKKEGVLSGWQRLDATERFLFNKLITGGFRVGVSQKLMTRALAQATDIDESVLAHRIMGDWSPNTTTYSDLILRDHPLQELSKPYPFFLAYAMEHAPENLGMPEDWLAERKWDGIRGQLILRGASISCGHGAKN
jgi:DNA ligase-1